MEEETGAEVFGKKAHHFFRKAWYSLSDWGICHLGLCLWKSNEC